MKILCLFFGFLAAQAPIPNRPTGWVYDPQGKGFGPNPIEVQGMKNIDISAYALNFCERYCQYLSPYDPCQK